MNILNYLIPVAQAHSGDGEFGSHMLFDHGFMGMGGSYMGVVFMVLFWILVIAGIVFLLRSLFQDRNKDQGEQDKSPKEILKERYAKGEINKEEFERKKKDLSQ